MNLLLLDWILLSVSLRSNAMQRNAIPVMKYHLLFHYTYWILNNLMSVCATGKGNNNVVLIIVLKIRKGNPYPKLFYLTLSSSYLSHIYRKIRLRLRRR